MSNPTDRGPTAADHLIKALVDRGREIGLIPMRKRLASTARGISRKSAMLQVLAGTPQARLALALADDQYHRDERRKRRRARGHGVYGTPMSFIIDEALGAAEALERMPSPALRKGPTVFHGFNPNPFPWQDQVDRACGEGLKQTKKTGQARKKRRAAAKARRRNR